MKKISALRVAVTIGIIISAGCGSGKSLFSSWTSLSTGGILDLSNGTFGAFSITWVFTGGAQCVSDIQVSGTETSGTYIITNSTYTSGGGGDPGCNLLNSAGTYTKTDTILRVCSGGSCASYE